MFHATANNIDDLMRAVFTRLLSGSRDNNRVNSKKGNSTEVFGALLQLTNPRARLGRSIVRSRVYSAIGELIWYLSGSDALAQIQYYIERYNEFSDDGMTLSGAYGPRIFDKARTRSSTLSIDEWQRVINVLRARSGSRNAVIQIYSNTDGRKASLDIPCTCTVQFAIRRNRLEMHVHMRSNDAFLGLPHDIFCFTMMQEIAARELGVEVGRYHHSVASLHLYDDEEDPEKLQCRTLAQRYLDEGLHDTVPMPAMPTGDPWPAIRELVNAENQLRLGNIDYVPSASLDPYWADLVTLLRAYAIAVRDGTAADLEGLVANINFDAYRLYILDRIAKRKQTAVTKDFFRSDGDSDGDDAARCV
jgi:thymidylate synthase